MADFKKAMDKHLEVEGQPFDKKVDATRGVRDFLKVLDDVWPRHPDILLTTGAATTLRLSHLRALVAPSADVTLTPEQREALTLAASKGHEPDSYAAWVRLERLGLVTADPHSDVERDDSVRFRITTKGLVVARSSEGALTGETPRTDALLKSFEDLRFTVFDALPKIQEHARQLERELAEAKKKARLYDYVAHRNSPCACTFDEGDNIIRLCAAHADLRSATRERKE